MNSLTTVFNFDTVCNDTLIKEIFPKLTLKALMNLRKTSHRYRELVSTYLKITTDSITMINVIREGGHIFSMTNTYCYGWHFEDKIKETGLVYHQVNVERWVRGELTLVIQASNGGHWYLTKPLLDNLWSIDSTFNYKIKDEKIQDYIYQTFIQAAIDEHDEQDDDLQDTIIAYFYHGIEIDKCFIPVYADEEETAIKKIENFKKRMQKISNCIVYC